jgi:hypothetical protein
MAPVPTQIPILWTHMTPALGMNHTIDKFIDYEIPKHRVLRQSPRKLQTDGEVLKHKGNYIILITLSSYV